MTEKYFTERQIYAATFFGGPIPEGILIFRNLKRMNEDRKASLALLFTVTFTFLLFFALFQIPESTADKIPSIAFPGEKSAKKYDR